MRPDWLVARPIAHRGLHDRAAGRCENSVSAAVAAVEGGFAIECDVQLARDGEAMVFHDFSLERMTGASGPVADWTSSELGGLTLDGSSDRITPLPAFLAAIDGRTPLVCEIKSAFDGDERLTERVATIASSYDGPIALKSFDPAVIAHLRTLPQVAARTIPLGIVAEARYDDGEWAALAPERKQELAALSHVGETRPDFLSYRVGDLPHAAAAVFRAYGGPVVAWTVRTPEQRERAARWADQMVFEGFRP